MKRGDWLLFTFRTSHAAPKSRAACAVHDMTPVSTCLDHGLDVVIDCNTRTNVMKRGDWLLFSSELHLHDRIRDRWFGTGDQLSKCKNMWGWAHSALVGLEAYARSCVASVQAYPA
eukprot:4749138-Prymnesium_polylepis.1